jgi:hypothetical protein
MFKVSVLKNTGITLKELDMRQSIIVLLLIWLLLIITVAAPLQASQVKTHKKITGTHTSMKQHLKASQVRTVEGIIQNVAVNSIQVRGQYYDISGIQLIDPSGQYLKKTSLTIGRKVEIFFQKNRITSILIFDDMVE